MEFGIVALAVPSGFAIFYAFRPLFRTNNKAR